MTSKPSKETQKLLDYLYNNRGYVNRKWQPQTWQPEIKKLFRKGYVELKRISGSQSRSKKYIMPGQSYLVLTEKGKNASNRPERMVHEETDSRE